MADVSSSNLRFGLRPRVCHEQTTRNTKGAGPPAFGLPLVDSTRLGHATASASALLTYTKSLPARALSMHLRRGAGRTHCWRRRSPSRNANLVEQDATPVEQNVDLARDRFPCSPEYTCAAAQLLKARAKEVGVRTPGRRGCTRASLRAERDWLDMSC
jgi:hypothetical protein